MTLEREKKNTSVVSSVSPIRITMPPTHPKQPRKLFGPERLTYTVPIPPHVETLSSQSTKEKEDQSFKNHTSSTEEETIGLISSLQYHGIRDLALPQHISSVGKQVHEKAMSKPDDNHTIASKNNEGHERLKSCDSVDSSEGVCENENVSKYTLISEETTAESETEIKDAKKKRKVKKKTRKHVQDNNVFIPPLPPPPSSRRGSTVTRKSVDYFDFSKLNTSTRLLGSTESSENDRLVNREEVPDVGSKISKTSPIDIPKIDPSNPAYENLHSSVSSDELEPPLTPYTPLLATPDLKIEMMDEERRLSMVGLGAPFFPLGFPSIAPQDLTPEEIHDFDMRWGSPHHAKGGKSLTRPTLLALPQYRPRMTSLPNREEDNDYDDDECYRMRHFSITGRGVVNRGDSFRSRRTRSSTSMASDVSSNEGFCWSHPCSLATSAASSAASSRASSASEYVFPFRVVILGGAGVGKTTLCHQFMTSEHINAYDNSLDDEYGEKSVCVMLDGEESEILFVDHPADEMSVENYIATYNPHAFILVFSVIDRQSFIRAEETLQYLWKLDIMATKAVILVANKTDLVRNRCVTQKESSSLANSYDCKFIETSSGLNLQVDELLVGILKQIRLKTGKTDGSSEPHRKTGGRRRKFRGTKTSASLKVKSLLTKVCGKDIKSKSCENLHVL